MITMYSTGCPKCNVLKKKLDAKELEYEICDDIEEMTKLGIDAVPVLKIGESLLNYLEAVTWVNNI